MAHSMYRVLLFSTIPWMTILWSLKILDNKAPYILSIIVACILALVYQCHIYPVYATPFKALPSLKRRSYLLGNHPSRPIKWNNGVIPQLCTEFSREQMVRFYTLLNIELIMVVGPEAIAEICLAKSDGFTHSQEAELLIAAALGHAGLFGARGEMHKRLRKMFAPVFTTATLATVCNNNSLWSRCLAIINEIDDKRGTSVRIGQWASTSILELVGICILGQSAGWLARYPNLAETLTRRHANGQHAKAILPLFPRPVRSLLMLTLFGRRELSDLTYLEFVARDLVQRATAKQEQVLGQRAINSSSSSSNSHSSLPPNLITAMLKDENLNLNLSQEEILGHVSVFLAGGSVTTSATFQWLIIELCRHPAVQTRLRREVRARWPTSPFSDTKSNNSNSNNEKPLLSQMENIPYLRAVIDEVLRIHPATRVTQREARRDMTITGIPIPKGTMLMIPPIAPNLNTRIWGDDAATFNPDRWLKANPANRSITGAGGGGGQQPCSILTFGHGPQGCPGRSLTRLILMCMAAAFVNEYEVSLEDPLQSFVPSEALFTFPTPELVVRLVKVPEA